MGIRDTHLDREASRGESRHASQGERDVTDREGKKETRKGRRRQGNRRQDLLFESRSQERDREREGERRRGREEQG